MATKLPCCISLNWPLRDGQNTRVFCTVEFTREKVSIEVLENEKEWSALTDGASARFRFGDEIPLRNAKWVVYRDESDKRLVRLVKLEPHQYIQGGADVVVIDRRQWVWAVSKYEKIKNTKKLFFYLFLKDKIESKASI